MLMPGLGMSRLGLRVFLRRVLHPLLCGEVLDRDTRALTRGGYDPCCSSAAMFVQSVEAIEPHATGNSSILRRTGFGKAKTDISICGQRSNNLVNPPFSIKERAANACRRC